MYIPLKRRENLNEKEFFRGGVEPVRKGCLPPESRVGGLTPESRQTEVRDRVVKTQNQETRAELVGDSLSYSTGSTPPESPSLLLGLDIVRVVTIQMRKAESVTDR